MVRFIEGVVLFEGRLVTKDAGVGVGDAAMG